jgi:molybdopterin-guanine dinucleotide biosynthesis protein B
VLIEGFKNGGFPKLEVWRSVLRKAPLAPGWPGIVALACDAPPVPPAGDLPCFDLGDTPAIADFAMSRAQRP